MWTGSARLPAGVETEYKLLKLQTERTFEWETDPNKIYTVPSDCVVSATMRNSWNA